MDAAFPIRVNESTMRRHGLADWQLPSSWERVQCLELHVGGEPLRVVTDGIPALCGDTMQERMLYARENYDKFRKRVLHEPRGHSDQYGCLLTQPVTIDGDYGLFFMDTDDYVPMCGHGTIAVTTALATAGFANVDDNVATINFDTPVGRVQATAYMHNGIARRVSIVNVASYMLHADYMLDVPDIGRVRCDIAYGGEWYFYVDVNDLGLDVIQKDIREFIVVGRKIKQAAIEAFPELPVYGVVFVQPNVDPGIHTRHITIFGNGSVDRSPCGTSVCGRLAVENAKNGLLNDVPLVFQSITDSTFVGQIVEMTSVDGRPAVIPQVTGSAHFTGEHTFYYDPTDPLMDGLFLR